MVLMVCRIHPDCQDSAKWLLSVRSVVLQRGNGLAGFKAQNKQRKLGNHGNDGV